MEKSAAEGADSDKDLTPASPLSSALQREAKEKDVRSEEVRRFSLGGLGAVSNSLGVLGCDSVTVGMPPASQKRNSRGCHRHQPSVYGNHQQSSRDLASQGSGFFPSQPARRNTTLISHPPLRSPALHAVEGHRKVRNSTSTMDYMDYMPSPESFCAPDFLKATFTSSPSSLYMYDQDRQGMHTSLPDAARPLLDQTCAAPDLHTLSAGEPEFDLHPQFENSNSLEGFFRGALGSGIPAGAHSESSLGSRSSAPKQELMTISQQDLNKLKPGLTLAESNLFKDSDSITGKLLPAATSLRQQMAEDVKQETSSPVQPELGPKTFTPLQTVRTNQSSATIVRILQQSQSNPSQTSATSLSELLTQNRTHKVSVVSPIPTTTTTSSTIKTEPTETDSTATDAKNRCFPKFLHSPSPQTTRVVSPTTQPPSFPSRHMSMSVGGQSRPPSLGQQGKSGSVEEKWKEIEKFIHDPSSDHPQPSKQTVSRKRKRHESGGSTNMSDEESSKSQRVESITDDDSDSDDDSDISDTPFVESLTELAKKSKQYFWQYNVQAKGPKGTRLQLAIVDNDPHRPGNFEDPVFDPTNTSLVGIRHGGKARKGDGNEVTPNPQKLYLIGQKLCRLNREINNVQLASNLPASVRSKSRREKNKLSSRACRLKKKAQHEANKIKLFGLNREQGELLEVVQLIWPKLREQAKKQMKENIPLPSSALAVQMDYILKNHNKTKTAGNTADYVNQVIARVEEGELTGGLAITVKVK